MKEIVAIIDLGSNSVRLALMEINEDGSFRIINEVKEMVRLSEGMGEEDLLKPDAMLRTLKAVQLFKKLCESSKANRIIAVATAAVRKAKNQETFLTLLKQETGIEFEVISGKREAELGFKGVECSLDISDGFVMDIGGASTEITQFAKREVIHSVSLPFGAVNLTEMYLSGDKNTPEQLQKLEKFIQKKLQEIPWLKAGSDLPLVGLGGTMRNLGKVDRLKKNYSYNIIHNYVMTQPDVEAIYNEIKLKDYQGRCEVPGMSKDRADIVIAGTCVANAVLSVLEAPQLIISGSGIREGIFFEYYMNRQAIIKISSVSEFSISNHLKLFQVNVAHARHVCKLSLSLFEQLQSLHRLPAMYRDMLEKACMLHDSGVIIDFYNRDLHTFYLVANSRINGLSHRETILVAIAAAKLTGERLRNCYMQYRDIITPEDYKAVKKLVAILSIADKLDRNKSGEIENIECTIKKDKVIIETTRKNDGELEIAEANKLQPLFARMFTRSMAVV